MPGSPTNLLLLILSACFITPFTANFRHNCWVSNKKEFQWKNLPDFSTVNTDGKRGIWLVCGGFDLFERLFYIQIVIWVLCKILSQTSYRTSVWKKSYSIYFEVFKIFLPKFFFGIFLKMCAKSADFSSSNILLSKCSSHSFRLVYILQFFVLEGNIHSPFLFCAVSNLRKSKTCQSGKNFCAFIATYQAAEDQAHFCLHLPFISHNCFGLLSTIFFCLSSYISPLTTSHAIIKIIPRSNSCSKQHIWDCHFAENESVILAIKRLWVFCQFCLILMKEWCIIPCGGQQKWVLLQKCICNPELLPRLI